MNTMGVRDVQSPCKDVQHLLFAAIKLYVVLYVLYRNTVMMPCYVLAVRRGPVSIRLKHPEICTSRVHVEYL